MGASTLDLLPSAGLGDHADAEVGLVGGDGGGGSGRPIEVESLEPGAEEVQFPGADGAFVAADHEAAVAHGDGERRDA